MSYKYLSIFKEMRDHNNNLSILLPNHFPKGCKGALNGSLSGNVGSGLTESIDKVGIQVVFAVFGIVAVAASVFAEGGL